MINRVNLALACERVCLYYRIGMWNQTARVKCVMHLVCGCECWACPDYYTIYYDIQHTLQCILNSPAFCRQLFFSEIFLILLRDCPIWKDSCLPRYCISANFAARIVCIALDNRINLLWESYQTKVQWKFEELGCCHVTQNVWRIVLIFLMVQL